MSAPFTPIQRLTDRTRSAAVPVRTLAIRVLSTAGAALTRLTALGGAALLGLLISLPLGWWAGWAEFRAIAVALSVALAIAVLCTLQPARYAGSIRLERVRARSGEQVMGELTVRNQNTRTTPRGRVDLPVGNALGRFLMPRLTPGAAQKEIFHVRTRHRAVIEVGPASTVRADPLGLIRRVRACTDRVHLFVHPAVVRIESGSLGFLRDVEGVATQSLSSSDVSFHALREYAPSDDRRSVHWRTTARTGKLMVRQFEETMRAHLLLILILRTDEYTGAPDFELAVSTAGSLAMAADSEGREVSLVTSAGPIITATPRGVVDQLCGVQLHATAPDLRETAATAAGAVPAASVAAIITGGLTQPGDLRAAHLALPAEISAFAVRCAAGTPTARRQIGMLTVLDIADLSQLPGGLRTLR